LEASEAEGARLAPLVEFETLTFRKLFFVLRFWALVTTFVPLLFGRDGNGWRMLGRTPFGALLSSLFRVVSRDELIRA
jgi:hypothetical protein